MGHTSISCVNRILLATALTLTTVASAGAFEVTAEQRAACMPDAFRLCSAEIPDVGRVLACMKAKQASLGSACRAVFQAAGLIRSAPSHQRKVHEVTYASYRVAPHRREAREAFAPRRRKPVALTYVSYEAPRHWRQAAFTRHHRAYGLGAAYARYGAPDDQGLAYRRTIRERLAIARKIMTGFAMACENHSIPADLCNLSESQNSEVYYNYQPAYSDDQSSAKHRHSQYWPENDAILGSLIRSFVQ